MTHQLLSGFKEGGLITIALWLALLAGSAYLFAGDHAAAFLRGLLRVGFSVIQYPVLYVRRCVRRLASPGRPASGDPEDDQFLLNGLIAILSAIVVAASLSIIASTLTAAWKAFIPPAELRESVNQARTGLEGARTDLTNATSAVVRMDTEWQRRGTSELAKARKPLLETIATADLAVRRTGEAAQQWVGTIATVMTQMKEGAASLPAGNDEYTTRRGRNVLQSIMNDHRHLLSEEDSMLAEAWINRWEQKASAELQLAQITPESVRTEQQPTYESARERKSSLNQSVAEKETELATLEKAAALRYGSALSTLALGAAAFVLFIWFYGLLLELTSLLVHVAGDVKRIRLGVEAREWTGKPLHTDSANALAGSTLERRINVGG